MAKKRQAKLSDNYTPLTRRIVMLGKLIWGGNKSRMAKAIDISHPVLSRVLRGQQEPPGKLLEALARWPSINVRWLFAGEGEPLSESNLWSGGGCFLPVAESLLPGAPSAHPELLTWTSFPVADALYSETAYWFRIPEAHLITKGKAAKVHMVKPGDYLLVETAPTWTQRLDAIRGRLCALRVQRRDGHEVFLAHVDPDADYWEAFYAVQTFPHLPTVRFRPEDGPDKLVDFGAKEIEVGYRNVVGVCVKLDRILSASTGR